MAGASLPGTACPEAGEKAMKLTHWNAAMAVAALLVGISTARAQDQPQNAEAVTAQAESGAKPAEAAPTQTPAAAQPTGTERFKVRLLDQDYSKGQRALPDIFKPYTAIRLPQQTLINASTIDQLIRDGKLQLNVEEAVALALQNNLDITIQRYVTYEADAGVLNAKAGPGFVDPFGPNISFDPLLFSTFGWQRTSIPVNNGFLSGTGASAVATALTNQSTVGNFGYNQAFPTGTFYQVTLNNTRQSSTSSANFFNPSVTSSMTLQITQPLLNGFGFTPNLRGLRVARLNRKIADLGFQQQLITTVTAVKNQYYELVFAQEDVEVKKKSVELAEKLFNDNKRQVEIGTLAPIEVTRAEAQLASTRADLIASQTLALQDETLLKQLILRNVMDPKLSEIPVVPTETPSSNVVVPATSLEDAVKEASEKRPDVRQAMLDLDAKKITSKATRNGLLPSLNLTGQYGTQGLGGNLTTFTSGNPLIHGANPIVDATGTPIMVGGSMVFTSTPTVTPGPVIPGGLGDALSNVFRSNFPNYSVFLNLNIPIRNRTAQAANINAMLLQEQSLATLQKVRNALAVDVHNAKIALEQDKYAVEANIRARILAEQTLDAEQKKFQLGASTIFQVIQAQRDLATARSNEVRSNVNFVEAKVNYDRALGRTLEENRIDVADNSDRLLKSPLIPGTLSGELAGEPAKY
jgi:outer membrane protein